MSDIKCVLSFKNSGPLPGGLEGKASACNAGDLGSIPGSGRSSGEGHGNPLQYSCLENPMDRGASQATVHGVTKSRTRLSDDTLITYCTSFQDCYNKLPLNGQLKRTEMYIFVVTARNLKSKCPSWFLLKSLKMKLSCAFLLISGSWQQSLVILPRFVSA